MFPSPKRKPGGVMSSWRQENKAVGPLVVLWRGMCGLHHPVVVDSLRFLLLDDVKRRLAIQGRTAAISDSPLPLSLFSQSRSASANSLEPQCVYIRLAHRFSCSRAEKKILHLLDCIMKFAEISPESDGTIWLCNVVHLMKHAADSQRCLN